MTVFSKKNNSASNHSTQSRDKSEESFFGVQAKLNIGKPNDKYEVEADAVADKVTSKKETKNSDTFFSASPVIQKKQNNESQEKEESGNEIQEKPLAESITPAVQLKAASDAPKANPDIEQKINSSKGSGSSLPENTKTEMESGFGNDFGNIRIHNDSNAVEMNKELGAQAFANGNDIYFNEGKFSPDSQNGKHLLAHELTHTVQQGGNKPVIQQKEEEPNSSTVETETNKESKTAETTSTETLPREKTTETGGNNGNNNGNAGANTSVENNPNTNSATNQANQSTTADTQNQSTTGATSENASGSTSETNSRSGGNSSVNQSTDAGTTSSDSSGGTSSSTTSTSETTSSSSGSSETTGGFASYDLFLAYVEEKKQASTIYFTNKKQELTEGINEEKRKNKETVQTEIDRLNQTKRATLERINTSHDQTTNAINAKRDTEIQNARDVADAEIARVDQVILAKTELITTIAETKAETVISTGSEESTQALTTTSNNVRQVDAIIRQKQSQYSGKENAGDIVQAAWSSKPETVQKIQESGELISSEIVSHSIKLAENYRTEATNVSSEFSNKKQEAVNSIITRRDEIIKAVTDAAKESLNGLDEQTTTLKTELETSVSSQLAILEQISPKIDIELDEVLTASIAKVNKNEGVILQEIDKFKNDISEIYWYNEEVTAAQNDLGKAIDEHHTDVDKYITDVIKKAADVSTEFKTEFTSSMDNINSALSETANGYQESAENLKTETINTIDENARTAETDTKTIADEVDAGLQEEVNKSETRWNTQFTEDVTNMRQTVSEALVQQTGILNQFSANLDEEFNRSPSWWDAVTDFISGMASGFWEGITSLWDALVNAMGTLIFWIIIAIIVIIILVLVFVVGIAFAVILKVLLVIGIIIGVLFAIYYFYRAFATEGLSPYERGRLFGRGLFEITLALIGAGVYTRLAGWIARIARISSIVARVGGLARFLRIVVLVEDVKAFIALLDRMADIERLILLMEKIKDVKALIKLLSSAPDVGRIIEALLNVGKADELLQILIKADDIGRVLSLVERGIQLGHAESLITILGKAKELAKLITVLERAGDDIGRAIEVLSAAPEIDKMIIAMERVGASNMGKLITLIQTVDDVSALLRIVTKAADFGTLLRLIEEATEVNKIVALFDKVAELDKLVIAFDSFADTNRLLAVFNGVAEFDRLVTVLSQSSALDRLVPFLEGLGDINAAIPKLQALAGEVDDFVRFLDEAGMTVGKLEKILQMENLTVAKLRNLLTQAGGVVDDLMKVLDEIQDLDKLTNFINHFGNFADLVAVVDKAIASGLSRATSGSTFILEFLEACSSRGFKNIGKITAFFDFVLSYPGRTISTWRETLQYGINFLDAGSVGNTATVAGRSSVGTGNVASRTLTLADGSTLAITVETGDIAHMVSRHTWKYFSMAFGNCKTQNSMWALNTEISDVTAMATDALNSAEVENLVRSMLPGESKLVMVGTNEVRINLGPRGIVSMYPKPGVPEVPKLLMKAAIALWQSI